MKRKNTDKASSVSLKIRCTPLERAAWKQLADLDDASLSEIVRTGLTSRCLELCMCQAGKPPCLKCDLDRRNSLHRLSEQSKRTVPTVDSDDQDDMAEAYAYLRQRHDRETADPEPWDYSQE